MHNYIIESMAMIGCGAQDVKDIAQIVSGLSDNQKDTLDAMHNIGMATTLLTPIGNTARQELASIYSDDDMYCLATYVSAYRSVN